MSQPLKINEGFPQMGEPAVFKVVQVGHNEHVTTLRMEYHFRDATGCPHQGCSHGYDDHDPQECHQTMELGMYVQPSMILPGDEVEVLIRHREVPRNTP